ncbi:hypothetical protein P153DRAFT_136930 [Dothidotthia symphoricarpi CBS 119687]|uniref:Uncharacterized protein n=1 Tax=Dothidotthia symphoricarpi CBS 119687 TaxID=1392245 RepID=A0A6A6A0G6_9PLEO|nr:uncharacterized protein P153DRAFT_136930 [Dothidotthia symphoricarpi CBS 119687]KAF2124188.1 hypothetical protein P153DRAFT_136930 [Dothidotthia symphoricarpi CBS 119687]
MMWFGLVWVLGSTMISCGEHDEMFCLRGYGLGGIFLLVWRMDSGFGMGIGMGWDAVGGSCLGLSRYCFVWLVSAGYEN